jgi:Flp pilus assembly protein TadG
MSSLRRFIGDRRGAAALEFALIGLPFVFLMLALIEFGRGLYIRASLDAAADKAQRVILINPSVAEGAVRAEISASFRAGDPGRLRVDIDPAAAGGGYRTVSLSYPMNLLMPAPIGGTITIVATRPVFLNH